VLFRTHNDCRGEKLQSRLKIAEKLNASEIGRAASAIAGTTAAKVIFFVAQGWATSIR
jgi:hypothetical protein